jgi:autotransporter-associated beta strand protein
MKTHLESAFRILATAFALASSAGAATMSASSTAPAVNGEDIANYGDVSSTDKWFTGSDGAARGQSITTGGAALRLKSITYQVSEGNGAAPAKNYTLRVGKLTGTVFAQVHSETATQNFSWTSGQNMTWTFATPVILEPYTTYGIDVGMTSSTSGWQTGIPYINVTGDDYAGGTSYTSGTNGIGTTAISSAIASDRTFHLDIERPLDPVFSLVSPSPADNATDAYASREIVMTFSQNVTPGTGSLTLRNLTDNIDTTLAPNDSRLTYDQNAIRISPGGLLAWNKNYAIRMDAGVFLGDAAAPIPAITDDTTWNFTTIAADPLLSAIAAIKAHVLNTAPLTGPQISAHKTTIDNNRQRFAENTNIINAVFDLISTYDTAKGPLFVSGFANNATSFDRNVTTGTAKNAVNPENYHWVIYTVMQHAMDLIYTGENLAKYESTLTNYKFGSHTSFPGPCSPSANPADTHTVPVNGSFPATFGRNTQMWTVAARKPTGTYLAPGTIATVTVPASFVNAGYKIRVGAHSWDLTYRRPVNRLERATRLYPITSTTIKVASPYGGGIYIEVPFGASAGVGTVTVTGGVRAPYFSAKSFHQTTATEWTTERTHPAPWADFQSDKFMFQVPRKWIYNMTGAQATQLMVDWDKAMDAINDLMGFDRNRGKETMYCQTDVILRSSVHAPGYPAVNVTSNVNSEVSPAGYAGNYLVRGPATTLTAANIEFHEQGHAYGFPKFGGESESNVNLLQPAMLYRGFGKTIDEAQNGSFGSGRPFITVDTTAIAWMCVFSFSPNEIPMQDGEKDYQHKGHAKWMDIARIYATPSNPNAGWEKLDAYWRSFMLDDANNVSYGKGTDDYLLRLSRAVGKDIRPLFHFWGIHPQNPSALAAALAAENLLPDPAIKNKLLHYKSIIPANNAAFRTFCLNWWGRQPTVAGYWEETDHAMQWDETLDADGSNNPNVRPNGSIYVETSATEIRARIDELIALYYPGALTPDPMTFAIVPSVVDSTTIGMTATTAVGGTGPIEYLFEETSGNPGGDDSAWQASPSYQDTGLTTGLTYTYRVSARSGPAEVPTVPSAALSATPTASGDITVPSPTPMTFATPPATVDLETITMTATTATDINGAEYWFENATNSTNSDWQSSPVYTETNLSPATPYTYRVKARDKSANSNETAFSATATANTGNLPDLIPPQIATLNPADDSVVSNLAGNLVVTFDEPVIAGSGTVTLKNLTDATETVFNIGNAALAVSGSSLTLNPPTDLLYENTYAIQISNGAVADASNNPFIGITDDTSWSFSTVLANPIVNTGGPYVVPTGTSLSLVASGIPSTGATLDSAGYSWDLNNNNTFDDATGATPSAIPDTVLTSTWGMVSGFNTIKLRVTDSLGNSTTVTTIVKIGADLLWDANGTGSNRTDGAGTWLNANQWRDGTTNTSWISGASPVFGVSGSGGAITLGANTTVGSLTFNAFSGTYSISGGGVLTVRDGFTNNSTAGAVSISTTLNLTAPQTWGGTSTGALTFSGGINNNGHTLTIGVNGTVTMNAAANIITGAGGLTKNGTGNLLLGANPAPAHTYSGPTIINGGVVMVAGNKTSGNMTLNNGMLTDYYRATTTFSGGLGTGPNQIQIYGDSGFGGGNGNSTWRIGAAGSVLTWGGTHFNPTSLKFLTSADNMGPSTYGQASLDNGLNLNGAARTINVLAATGANALANSWAKINGAISGGGGSLIKTGGGNLILAGAGTYNGGTTVQAGMLQLANATALGATSGPLTVNGGILNLNDQNASVGNLSGTSGTIANNGNAARTLTIGNGNATGGNYLGVIANRTNTGTGTLALTKTGTGTITLTNSNTFTGATAITGGSLIITGPVQATTAITFASNSSLGLVIGSPVTAASAAVNFANGLVSVSGTPSAQSHVLLTAQSFTGTPALASPVAGYELKVIGNQLQLNQVATNPFTAWSAGADFEADSNNDGVNNGLAWIIGAADPNAHATSLLPTLDNTSDADYFIFNYRRSDAAATDANTSMKVQYGSALAGWTDATAGPDIVITISDDFHATGIDKVAVKIRRSLAVGGKLFTRLHVTGTP